MTKEYKVMMEYYAGETFFEIFKKEYIMIIQSISLIVLYVLHWWWFALLVRIGYRALLAYYYKTALMCRERQNYRKIQKEEYEGDSDVESDSEEEEKAKTDFIVC